MDQRNRRAISKVEENLSRSGQYSQQEEEELKLYYKILEKVDLNNKVLENTFNSYEFTDEVLEQNMTDYKVYVYEFITDTIMESMKNKIFKDKKSFINHINAAQQVIHRHFTNKFYIPEDLDKIFEKAIESIYEKVYPNQGSLDKTSLESIKII